MRAFFKESKRVLLKFFVPSPRNNFRPQILEVQFFYILIGFLVAVKLLSTVSLWNFLGADMAGNISKDDLYSLTNQVRNQQGLPSLSVNPTLQEVASLKLKDMFQKNYFGHISPEGTTPWYWFDKAGYPYRTAGENLAMDFVFSKDVVEAWMNSESHRQNILLSDFREIGIAVGSGYVNGRETVAVVQVFGSPIEKKTNPSRSAVISNVVQKTPVPTPIATPIKTPVKTVAVFVRTSPVPTVLPMATEQPKPKLAPISLAKEVAQATASSVKTVYNSELVEKAPEAVRRGMDSLLVFLAAASVIVLMLKVFVAFRVQYPVLIFRAVVLVAVTAWMVWSGPDIFNHKAVVITQKAETFLLK